MHALGNSHHRFLPPTDATDYFSLLSLALGMGALFMKQPLFAWTSLLVSASSVAGARSTMTGEGGLRQTMSSAMIALMSVLMCEQIAFRMRQAAAAAAAGTN